MPISLSEDTQCAYCLIIGHTIISETVEKLFRACFFAWWYEHIVLAVINMFMFRRVAKGGGGAPP